MSVSIEPARAADAESLVRLIGEFNHPYREIQLTTEQVLNRLSRCEGFETTYVARLYGEIVGFVCVRIVPNMSDDEPYAEITDLFVDGKSRRQGVAQDLLAHAEEAARESGARVLVVITSVDNEAAQSLYQKCEFRPWASALKKQL